MHASTATSLAARLSLDLDRLLDAHDPATGRIAGSVPKRPMLMWTTLSPRPVQPSKGPWGSIRTLASSHSVRSVGIDDPNGFFGHEGSDLVFRITGFLQHRPRRTAKSKRKVAYWAHFAIIPNGVSD